MTGVATAAQRAQPPRARPPRARFALKRADDGSALLNLGCGTRTHPDWNNLDFSPYARFAHWPRLSALAARVGLISAQRYRLLRGIDPAIIHWDLRRGIPFPDDTFDVVYHSHLLEHLDRDAGEGFLRECLRATRPGGIIRIAVPDLRYLAERYLETLAELDRNGAGDAALARHEVTTEALFGQMVRREYTGQRDQHPVLRRLERLVRGDAERAGELHRWMYDRHTLARLLERAGFVDPREEAAATSRVPRWARFHLDTNPDGSVYKPESLFMEAVRPETH
jgi:SAM-dependent methyltransferase